MSLLQRWRALPRRPLWLGLGLAILLAIALVLRAGKTPEVSIATAVQAYPSQALSVLNASGYVVAQRKAAISTRAQGRLEWLGVAEGSPVKAGDLIARLENAELTASLAQAKAQLGLAQAELDDARREANRAASLLNQSFISQAAHDAAQSRFAKARAQVRAAEAATQVAAAALSQSEIRAPFDGVVLTKSANVGDNITPFSNAADSKGAVVTLADMATLEVETDVSESSLDKIRIGQPVEIGLDAIPGERFSGKVARMVPTIDRAKATRLVKVSFDAIDSRVLPDMSAKVVFLQKSLGDDDRVPFAAAVRRAIRTEKDGSGTVFRLQGTEVQALAVPAKDMPAPDSTVTVVKVEGLKVGDRLVLEPSAKLASGDTVRIATK